MTHITITSGWWGIFTVDVIFKMMCVDFRMITVHVKSFVFSKTGSLGPFIKDRTFPVPLMLMFSRPRCKTLNGPRLFFTHACHYLTCVWLLIQRGRGCYCRVIWQNIFHTTMKLWFTMTSSTEETALVGQRWTYYYHPKVNTWLSLKRSN